jgi:hypothetical protein
MSHFAERLWRPLRRQSPSPRLAVEPLEGRLTPAISLNFFPAAVVQVNPQPIPPLSLVQFIPEPTGSPSAPAAGAPAGAAPFHSQGHLRESVQGGWVLDAVYTLDGKVTQTETPGPMGTDSVAVSYDYMAHVTEALVLPNARGASTVWLCDSTQSSHGGASVEEIVVTKHAFEIKDLVAASFHDTTTAHELCRKAGENPLWKVDATVASQGTLNGVESHVSGAGAGKHKVEAIDLESIHIDSVLAATLAPLDPSGKPGPAWDETVLCVTKDVSRQQVAFALPLPGEDLSGTVGLDTSLSVMLKPPTNPGDPPPPPELFSSHVRGHEDFSLNFIELDS